MENEFLINQGKSQFARPKSFAEVSNEITYFFFLKSSAVTYHLRAASTSFGIPADQRYHSDPILCFLPVGWNNRNVNLLTGKTQAKPICLPPSSYGAQNNAS